MFNVMLLSYVITTIIAYGLATVVLKKNGIKKDGFITFIALCPLMNISSIISSLSLISD